MKIAFNTECCPHWTFPEIARKARELGYDGVELSGEATTAAPVDLVLDDTARNLEVLGAFADAGVEIACIAAPVRYVWRGSSDAENATLLHQWVDLAAELTCRLVMIRDPKPKRGMSGGAIGAALGDWLAPIADHALGRGVTLVVRNESTLTSARLMWTMLERLGHPGVGCCWDLEHGVRAGESPAVSVPTLNSRIRHARVGNIRPETDAAAPREPGVGGDVQLFLTRLLGIGYDGYVAATGSGQTGQSPDEFLKEMAATLKKRGTGGRSNVGEGRKNETRPKAG